MRLISQSLLLSLLLSLLSLPSLQRAAAAESTRGDALSTALDAVTRVHSDLDQERTAKEAAFARSMRLCLRRRAARSAAAELSSAALSAALSAADSFDADAASAAQRVDAANARAVAANAEREKRAAALHRAERAAAAADAAARLAVAHATEAAHVIDAVELYAHQAARREERSPPAAETALIEVQRRVGALGMRAVAEHARSAAAAAAEAAADPARVAVIIRTLRDRMDRALEREQAALHDHQQHTAAELAQLRARLHESEQAVHDAEQEARDANVQRMLAETDARNARQRAHDERSQLADAQAQLLHASAACHSAAQDFSAQHAALQQDVDAAAAALAALRARHDAVQTQLALLTRTIGHIEESQQRVPDTSATSATGSQEQLDDSVAQLLIEGGVQPNDDLVHGATAASL